MDPVQETPSKRRKLENDNVQSQGYDSQNDSGDDIFGDYETVATLPLPVTPAHQQAMADTPSSPPAYITQPTQIISKIIPEEDNSGCKQPHIQVPASSPAQALVKSPPVPMNRAHGGKLACSMAPAGTAFRLPVGVSKAPASNAKSLPTIDISDDDLPTYKGSSDEESSSNRRADIKPTTFIARPSNAFGSGGPRKCDQRFKEITANSFYHPVDNTTRIQSSTSKRSGDIMPNADGGIIRPSKQQRQNVTAKAPPAQDMNINDIQDFQVRSKISRMRIILPQYGIRACKRALEMKKFNYDDAIDYLIFHEEDSPRIDLTVSDGEDSPVIDDSGPKKTPAKQHVRVKQNIQEKWTATQPIARETSLSHPLKVSALAPSPPPKPRRRLVQGRKHPSSPASKSSPSKELSVIGPSSPNRNYSSESGASDSGIGSESDPELEIKVLKFFNTCSGTDLADIAMTSSEIARTLLTHRPFHSLVEIRQISSNVSSETAKRRIPKKPIGDKIVDKCLDMWTGYEAVDKLVKRCEEISKPLKADMETWGVNIFGAASDGELELTSFSNDESPRDSGIGTPRSISLSDPEDGDVRKGGRRHGLFPQPSNMAKDIRLKDYQIVGINWLSLLFEKKLSCILADDMGLGKTCQVIAFFAYLHEKGVKGPHVVIVPGSTLENWLREFSVFCPQLHVMPYYASQSERPGIQLQILDSRDTLNVVITTYTLAKQKDDNKFLRKLNPVVCVYDEGHLLKNSKSAGYDAFMRISPQFRLLLTGTPLQNNLKELTSLLGFILPEIFKEHSQDLEAIFSHKAKTSGDSHAALLSDQRIARAKSMMTPFVLRRKKHQVLRHLPAKTRRIEHCDLSSTQIELYNTEKKKASRILTARAAGEKTGNETSNIMMALRKASIHPLLFRRLYDDVMLGRMSKVIVQEEQFQESNIDLIYEDMQVMTDMELHRLCEANPRTMSPYLLRNDEWMDSGKISKLASLLKAYKENGDRVLVFSQFTMVLDILESVMETLGMRFFRLDGRTNINERQTMIDQFYEEKDITVFLLSTKAGGAGINLACSNKVIIFDSSFNPQDDIQAGKERPIPKFW